MTILASEKPQKWPYLNSRFFKVSVNQSPVTLAKINIFPSFFLQLLEDYIPENLMNSDFRFRPPNNFEPNAAKFLPNFWQKWGQNFLEA